MVLFTRACTKKSCWIFLNSNQTKALFLTPFIPPFCSHAIAKALLVFHCFVCSSKSQSHLFGNWLHSAALISIWNRQQHFAVTAWTGPAFHAASSRFLPFFPHTFSECRGQGQNKTVLMKAWRHLSGCPMWQERDVSAVLDRCFLNGWPWEGSLVSTFVTLSQEGSLTVLCFLQSISKVAFFRVTLPVMSLHPCWHLFCAIVISQWGLRRLGGFILMKIPLLLFFVGQ